MINKNIPELILVASVWKAQPWCTYTTSAETGQSTTTHSLVFRDNPTSVPHHLTDILSQLVMWVIPGRNARLTNFEKQLPSWSTHPEERNH